jgi:hypothetical protein
MSIPLKELVARFHVIPINEDETTLLAVSDQKNTAERLLESHKIFPNKLTVKMVTSMQFQTWNDHLLQDTSRNLTYTAEENNSLGIALENI